VRIKLGIKACSIVSSMVLSLVVIAGCNEEPTTPAAAPAGGASAPKGEAKPAPTTPPPSTPAPKEESKKP
jgi:hypothetical protein